MSDSSWVSTRTDAYLYEAGRLEAAKAAKGVATPDDYAKILGYLLPATKEQLLVFQRLIQEVRGRHFIWQAPSFVQDPGVLTKLVHSAIGSAQAWGLTGSFPGAALATFLPLSKAFCSLLDCNEMMRKQLRWNPPHHNPPTEGGSFPGDPPPVPVAA